MGQGGVGKTAMVLRYTTGDFNEQVRARARCDCRRARGDAV
jgi:GTPase SAR1 family protein